MRLSACIAIAALALAGATAQAQTYPTKPVRVVVPFPPGGVADIVARLVAQKLSESMSQTFVVENRAGAGGTIGSEVVAKSAPDGYTLLMATTSTHAVAPSLYSRLPYSPEKDFAPITNVASSPLILIVGKNQPIHSVRELIALAKANPDKLSFASSGNGTVNHITGEMFKMQTGTVMTHVPYKGSALAFPDIMNGRVTFMFDYAISALPQIRSGAMRGIAVTSAKRSAMAPDLPTMIEAGLPGFEASLWVGFFAPAGTPQEIVNRLHDATVKALASKEMKEKFAQQGAEAVGNTPAEFAAEIRADTARWARVVKASGAHID